MNFLLPTNRQPRSFTFLAARGNAIIDAEMVSKVLAEGEANHSNPSGYSTTMYPKDIGKLLKENFRDGVPVFLAIDLNQYSQTILSRSYLNTPLNYTVDIIYYSQGTVLDEVNIDCIKQRSSYDSLTVIELPNEKDE